ncbi:MAG: phosphoenolpyruvate synthase, partial [Dehalococcoidia bacterium]|nr:phosphoenolpyruvate synthase [Dehalococcoidia bacterium]
MSGAALTQLQPVETTTFIRPLNGTRADDDAVAGSKAANLGELLNAGIPVPPGFAITIDAFRAFLAGAQLADVLPRHLTGLNVDDPERLAAVSTRVRKLITSAAVPKALEAEFRQAYAELGAPIVAVRPSVFATTTEAAIAGQLTSHLNVQGADAALQAVKACWASLYDERSLFFRAHQQIDHLSVAVGVLVQQMVPADISGIMFTADPVSNDLNHMVIEAALGQGEAVLTGTVTPDMYSLDKASGAIQERSIARQHWQLSSSPAGSASSSARQAVGEAEGARQKLTDKQILALASLGRQIEDHFGWPQDIEWVLQGGDFQIVQTKPVSGLGGAQGVPWGPRKELTGKLLVSGVPASPGFATGAVRILLDPAQARDVQPGDILVTAGSHPDFLVAMKRASAVVTDTGGRTSHAAIVGRELGIPCIVGAESASKLLHDGQIVTVDGTWGRVLEGAVQLKSAKTQRQRAAIKTRTGVLVNLAEPGLAEAVSKRDVDGVGLLRAEFMMTDLGEHPRHALNSGRREVWIEQLAEQIERFCAAFTPRSVLYRTSDFNTKEYRSLTGGQEYEGEEENPMLGYRGAARYLNDPEAFIMEIEALKRARRKYANLSVMVPFVRTTRELQEVKRLLSNHGLRRSKTFELWMMAEVPSNVLLLD